MPQASVLLASVPRLEKRKGCIRKSIQHKILAKLKMLIKKNEISILDPLQPGLTTTGTLWKLLLLVGDNGRRKQEGML